MALTGSVQGVLSLTQTNVLDLVTASATLTDAAGLLHWAITSGTGANQADQLWSDTRTLALSTGEDLDLAGGITDVYGNVLTMARVKMIYITAASTNGSTISVGGASATQFVGWVANSSDIVKIRPGGGFMLIAPDATAYVVGAGTADLLKVLNDDGAAGATYSIIIVGASA